MGRGQLGTTPSLSLTSSVSSWNDRLGIRPKDGGGLQPGLSPGSPFTLRGPCGGPPVSSCLFTTSQFVQGKGREEEPGRWGVIILLTVRCVLLIKAWWGCFMLTYLWLKRNQKEKRKMVRASSSCFSASLWSGYEDASVGVTSGSSLSLALWAPQ